MDSPWPIIFSTLILSAFFSGIEIAFISSNRLKLELDKKKGAYTAHLISHFADMPTRFMGALLLGNNIALVLYSIGMTQVLNPWLLSFLPESLVSDSFILLSKTILATLILLLFAEFLPKAVFRIHANEVLRFFSIPVVVFYYLFYPVIIIYLSISEFIIKNIFRVKTLKHKTDFSYIDLDRYLKAFAPDNNAESNIQQELQMFQNAIDFKSIKLRECMVPRTEVVAVNKNDPVETLRNAFIEYGLSRVMIYSETLDNIIGYCHSSDLFKKPETILEVTRNVSYVPETMHANDVLSIFIDKNQNIAVVVDEFGGTAGLVTMEDIIEEIFGEIEDEYDEEFMIEKKIDDDEYIFSSRLEIDYLNEKYNLTLPESEDYETLSGLLIHFQESIPRTGQRIEVNQYTFIVLAATRKRVEKV
ncbi:MAG: hemolysin family protein, partial [Bacteroidota bacterium]